MTYGGMPQVVLARDERTKMKILESLFSRVYLKDVVERHKIPDGDVLDEIVNVVCSSVGSLTNPKKLSDTIRSAQGTGPSVPTVRKYLEYLRRAYLFRRAERFDVRGRKYFDYPCKYYAEDAGLRNVRLGFREQEETHLMENIIHNELVGRGYAVDVGVVESRTMENGKRISCPLEIDFVVNTGKRKVYLQSAYGMDDPRQREREKKPLMNTGDSFSKIIVTNGNQKLWTDDDGIHHIGILQFMLDSTLLDRI